MAEPVLVFRKWLSVVLFTCTFCVACNEPAEPRGSESILQGGWNEFTAELEDAREALDNPLAFPPSSTDRNLAEGYRYLLGHLVRIIEAELQQHPDFPYFQRGVRMLSKWTIDNPDTMYLLASIDPKGSYLITGKAADTTEWETGKREKAAPKAPRIVIFQTTTSIIGQTGGLSEMAECRNQTLDFINSFDLEIENDGSFTILVGPKTPHRYTGNFLPTQKVLPCIDQKGNTTTSIRDASVISVREIFSDWNNEEPLELSISRIDKRGQTRPPISAKEMAQKLSRIGELVNNQVRFWNLLHEFGLEVNGDRNLDGKRNQPLNEMSDPSPPFIAGGTAGARQLYASGGFELTEDEALVIALDLKETNPHYIGFHLANLWGESTDQANYTSSLSGGQLETSTDGVRYYIVSARDPGVAGWVDTTGLEKGTMNLRLIYRGDPSAEELPTAKTFRTPISSVRDFLPADTAEVLPENRRVQLARRQEHIQKRWRQY